jgi:hypothetical protein
MGKVSRCTSGGVETAFGRYAKEIGLFPDFLALYFYLPVSSHSVLAKNSPFPKQVMQSPSPNV